MNYVFPQGSLFRLDEFDVSRRDDDFVYLASLTLDEISGKLFRDGKDAWVEANGYELDIWRPLVADLPVARDRRAHRVARAALAGDG